MELHIQATDHDRQVSTVATDHRSELVGWFMRYMVVVLRLFLSGRKALEKHDDKALFGSELKCDCDCVRALWPALRNLYGR